MYGAVYRRIKGDNACQGKAYASRVQILGYYITGLLFTVALACEGITSYSYNGQARDTNALRQEGKATD